MERAYVGVGSNVEPERNILSALMLLLPEGLASVSTVYRTEPVGAPGQPRFYNCVAELFTGRPPVELKYSVLRRIEEKLGRRRNADRYSPRQIDLDLIVYGSIETNSDGLTLPDPDIFKRAFLAIPLLELAPDLILPGEINLRDVAEKLGPGGMEKMGGYTERIRKELFG